MSVRFLPSLLIFDLDKRMNDAITFESVPDDKDVWQNVESVPPRALAEPRVWAPPLITGFGASSGSGGAVA
jgi:hypothetical protein